MGISRSISRRMAHGMALLLPLVVGGGCLSGSPPVHYFLLTPMASSATPSTPAAAKAGVDQPLIVVDPVEIPPYLNRSQMVTRSSENHLQLAQYEQWGDTLRENISRVVLENLSTLLGTNRLSFPTAQIQERPALRIVSQISAFERGADGRIVLKVRWRLLDGQAGKVLIVQQSQFTSEPVEATDFDGMAAGMSGLLLEWSREMAREMRGYLH